MADGPRLGSTLCREREFNRLGRVLDEVLAVNGGEAPANGEEVRIAGVGSFGTRSRPARTGRTARTGEAVSISASVSPSFWGRKGTQGCGERRLEVVAVGWPLIPTWNVTDTPYMEPADYDTMTDPPGLTALLPGNPNVADGLRAWLLPAWISDCIFGCHGRHSGRAIRGNRA